MKKVFVMGSLNMDAVFEVASPPEAGETVRAEGFFLNPGGKGANQAVAAARQNAETIMLGAAGRDVFGSELVAELKKYGVRTEYVVMKECSSGMAGILVHNGENRIVVHGGANALCRFQDFADALSSEAEAGDVFVTQLEIDPDAVLEGLRFAKSRGMFTIFNPAPASVRAREMLPLSDVVCLNETETGILTGIHPEEDTCAAAGELIRKAGAGAAVITLGAAGSVLVGEKITRMPVPDVKVVDTTAAGDTYIGAMAARIAAGDTLERAAEYASAASVLAVRKRGAQRSIPDAQEVLNFLRSMK